MSVLFHLMIISLFCHGMMQIGHGEEVEIEDDQDDLTFYSFPIMDITENLISLDEYKGKVSLVVNVASQCGYTDGHYRMLSLLQKMFDETDMFTVLAFPCNQFGGQEPGTHQEILDFAYNTMNANFPVFAKVDIINQDVNPAWNYLIKSSGQTPSWNFWKYLVDHHGHVINAWGPSISPDQLYHQIQDAVNKAVAASPKANVPKAKEMETVGDKPRKDEF